MRKILFIIISLLITASVRAQIQRSFWGCTLNVSRRNVIHQNLTSYGFTMVSSHDYHDGTIAYNYKQSNGNLIQFEGLGWDYLVMTEYNGILFEVTLQMSTATYSLEMLSRNHNYIISELRSKYNSYYLTELSDGKPFTFGAMDKETTCVTSNQLCNGIRTVYLQYVDTKTYSIWNSRN